MVVQREPHVQQQAALQHAAGHRGIADGAQQDCVVALELVDEAFRQSLARRVVAPRAQVVLGPLHPGQHRVEHLQRLGDDLRTDAVTGDNSEFHDRSTTSSVVASTAEAIAARTSSGTSVSRRSITMALSPSTSWLSCAARMLTFGPAEQGADLAERSRLIVVVDDEVVALGPQVEVAAVDLDDLLDQLRAGQGARHVQRAAVGVHGAHVDHAAVVGALGGGADLGRHPTVGGQRRCVDERHLLVDHRGEQAAQRRQPQDLDIFGSQLAAHLHGQRHRGRIGQRTDQQTELAHQVQPGRHLLADGSAADVDGVRHELAGQGQLHAGGHIGAGPVLRLGGRGTQVRGHHDLGQLEQRAVGARFGREHVQAGGAHVAAGDGVGQGLLVDQAAAGGVDDDDARLGLGQVLLAEQARGLLGLGQVHRDEVGAAEQLVQRQQLDTELGGAGLRDVGSYATMCAPKAASRGATSWPMRPRPDDADGLAEDLDARERRPLPGVLAQGRVGGGDLAGRGQQQGQGVLGGAVDVGGRRVDHQHPAGGRGVDVDVVQADAGAGDDLEFGRRGDDLGVHRGGGAHQQRVGVRRRQPAAFGRSGPSTHRTSTWSPRAATVDSASLSAIRTTGRLTRYSLVCARGATTGREARVRHAAL